MKSKKIGSYERKVTITFNSIPAFILAMGKAANPNANTAWEKKELIGVRGFKNMTYTLLNQSRQDNPYADYYLIQIEKKIDTLLKFLDEKDKDFFHRLQEKFLGLGIKAEMTISSSPRELVFDFGMNPYATAILEVMAKYDRLHIVTDTCLTHRCLDKIEGQLVIQQATKMVRLLFDYVRDHVQKIKNDENYRISRSYYESKQLNNIEQDIIKKERLPTLIQDNVSDTDIEILEGLYGLDGVLDKF